MSNLQKLILKGFNEPTWADAEVYFSNAFGLQRAMQTQNKEALKVEAKKAFLNLHSNNVKTLNEMEILSPSNLEVKQLLKELGIDREEQEK